MDYSLFIHSSPDESLHYLLVLAINDKMARDIFLPIFLRIPSKHFVNLSKYGF